MGNENIRMYKLQCYILLTGGLLFSCLAMAQQVPPGEDTFFLAKKKGLLGRLGKSISRTIPPETPPEKLVNPFLKYKGKIIRSVVLARMDFGQSVYDTCEVNSNFGTRLANTFHRKTSARVLANNLFFRPGSRLYPNLLADNERYLRELVFIQDARILVEYTENSTDSVDVVVITRDVFSLGGKIMISSNKKGRAELKDENFAGSGNRVLISSYYEVPRSPSYGWGAEYSKRNIRGSFIDFTTGFQNYRPSFNGGDNQETGLYARLEKPMVTPYKPTTGAIEAGYYRSANDYWPDSTYRKIYRYSFYNSDIWLGYSLDSRRALYASKEVKVHRFIALRAFSRYYFRIPDLYKDSFDFRYTNTAGALASINIFRQSFYRASFIYGFGRSEDVPEGFSVSVTAGYINSKVLANTLAVENPRKKRPYAGLDAAYSELKSRGAYFNYTFRMGGYYFRHRFEDVDMLAGLEHFSKLVKLGPQWYHRAFFSTSLTAQVNPALNSPLYLKSQYGLDYFQNGTVQSDLRFTLKGEAVFYNMQKVAGFRFAPFAFGDITVLKQLKMGLNKSDFYSAIGGGIRTRNENLVFGTIELKGYYFPRTTEGMRNWKVELNSNIRFSYLSNFIRRPDFIIAN